jgi:hypothetical protein
LRLSRSVIAVAITPVDLDSDCTETFRWPRLLMENNVRHIEQRTALKPSTRPTVPQQLLPSPELGQNIPAWAVLAPAVRIPRIPKERRKTLRAWVTPPTQHLMHYLDAHVDHLSGTAQHLLMSQELIPTDLSPGSNHSVYYILLLLST